MSPPPLTFGEVLKHLSDTGEALKALYAQADHVRRQIHGDAVHLRALIEFSNHCANNCLYCGIRAGNAGVPRYRMGMDEILTSAHAIAEHTPCGTIVLQGGETPGYTDLEIEQLIRRLAAETPLAITLSIGNRPRDVYARWRDAGLHRYLLRFETADPDLFRHIHPDCVLEERLQCLRDLKAMGLQTGSGFMVGIPGETTGILAKNLLLCREMDFDMVGIGPFIPSPGTPMGGIPNIFHNDPDMPFRAYALLRLLLPRAHIPATTALDAFQPQGRWKALQVGANVYMPNMTPLKYRNAYLLYPNKPGVELTPEETIRRVLDKLAELGRPVAQGRGDTIAHPLQS